MFWDFGEDLFSVEALFKKSMTAIARIYTPDGFVVAADGRALRNAGTVHNNEMQKIVMLRHATGEVICSSSGIGSTPRYTMPEHAYGTILLVDPRPVNFEHYLEILSEKICQRVRGEFASRRSPLSRMDSTTASLHLDGYFQEKPVRATINISPDEKTGASSSYSVEELQDGSAKGVGFEAIWIKRSNLIATNMADAIKSAKEIIELHCSEESERIHKGNPDLPPVWPWGGHIHMATVTLADGFQWVHGFEPIDRTRR